MSERKEGGKQGRKEAWRECINELDRHLVNSIHTSIISLSRTHTPTHTLQNCLFPSNEQNAIVRNYGVNEYNYNIIRKVRSTLKDNQTRRKHSLCTTTARTVSVARQQRESGCLPLFVQLSGIFQQQKTHCLCLFKPHHRALLISSFKYYKHKLQDKKTAKQWNSNLFAVLMLFCLLFWDAKIKFYGAIGYGMLWVIWFCMVLAQQGVIWCVMV